MNATDMTKGKPMKLLFLFSLPLMFGNVFQQLYTVVDTMIVGQTLGVSALAALGAAESLGWMSLGSIQGLTQGFSIRMAQQFGAKDEDGLHQAVGHSIVLSALLAVLLTIVFQAAVRPVLAIRFYIFVFYLLVFPLLLHIIYWHLCCAQLETVRHLLLQQPLLQPAILY